MSKRFTRRTFLRTSAAASAVTFAGPLLRTRPAIAANEKLSHACIGVGGMGAHDLGQFLNHPRTEVVAICDVDENILKAGLGAANGRKQMPRVYADWRELLAKEGAKIDSINATIPDHSHAIVSLNAMKAGKHVYCQKPLCHDVAEVRAVTQASMKEGIVTQLGTQHASGDGDRTAVQWLRDGLIGKVKRVVLCSNRPGAIDTYRLVGPRPEKGQEPPANLNWDVWIGNASMRPYVPSIYHQTMWRAWQDFGTGWLGDIGCHVFDAVWKGLGLTAPKTVHARVQESWKDSPARRGDTWPQSDHITWIFPGNKLTETDELTVEWFDGLFYPPEQVQALYPKKPYPEESSIVIGTEGAILLANGRMPVLLPGDKFKDQPKVSLKPRNHYHHFLDCCINGTKTESYFAQTGPMTEAILLGTVAIRVPGQTLEWDAAKMKFPNAPEAEKFLRREYREGWV